MKLNRGILWGSAAAMTTALVAGALVVTVVGIDRPADADAQIGQEQGEVEAQVAGSDDSTVTASLDGTEQYRGGGHSGGGHAFGGHAGGGYGHAGGGYGHAGGGYGHTGWGHGGYGHAGWGRGYGGRGWGGRGWGWGGSRWGHWGGGRWVDGRWVAGPYWGWCDARYYDCARYWW